MKRFLIIVTLIAFVAGTIALLAYAGYDYAYNRFFKPNETVVSAFSGTGMHLVIEGNVIEEGAPAVMMDEEILIPFNIVKEYFDPYINWDEATSTVTITTKDRLIRMQTENLNALINNEPIQLNIPVRINNGIIYIPIDFLKDFYEIDITYISETDVTIIDYRNSIRQTAQPLTTDAVIRTGPAISYPIIRKLSVAVGYSEINIMRVFEEYKDWYKVRTIFGEIGFINKEDVVVGRMYMENIPVEEKNTALWLPENGKISLVFDQFRTTRPNLMEINMGTGVDVVSPTWLDTIDAEGSIRNYSDKKYIDWAHQNNYKVWALVTNNFYDPGMTHSFLNDLNARDNFIKQILAFSSLYSFDGINIDFENINIEDKDALTQFVREITPLLHEQGLVVSMDVGVPDGSENYSRCYDLPELGKAVDYIILMTYDQHWSTSPIAGSVAQYEWVEQRIRRTLEFVPAEKLIMGVPFYIRVWEQNEDENGKVTLTSKAYSMEYVKELISEKGAAVV
ncbi:MAG: glycosyl hydrolase family 18 protein, partial [Eubacteriales bacterium]|nr:glycosyl hydrolase family 18 protein [Eubacteriales bacterium]